MVQQVRLNGVIHRFPDEATPAMIAEALGVEPPDDEPSTTNASNQKAQNFDYLTGGTRTGLDTLRDLAAGGLIGLGKGGQFIASSLTGGRAPTVNMDEIFEPIASPRKSVGGEVTKGIGEYLPYGVAGGETLLPKIGKATGIKEVLKNILANPGQIAAGLGGGAALTEPDESNFFGLLPQGRAGGAIENAILNTLTHGGAKALEALRPSKMFRGNLTPDELQRNLDITSGTETGLGDVIESPFLKKRFENTLTMTPFSGANESLQRTGKKVLSRGENLLQKFLGERSPDNVPSQIADELQTQFKKHQENKNALYKNVNDLAKKSDLKLELPNFSSKAKEFADAIENAPLLKSEPDIAKIYNKLKNYQNPVKETKISGAILDKNGKPILQRVELTYPTLEEANILKGKLNQYAKMAAKSPDPAQRNTARIFGNLADDLKTDIKSSIDASKNDELKSAYKEAESNYSKNFSPFLDKEIYKYVSGNADPETIVNKFLKTSPTQDLANQLAKLSDKIPPQSRRLIAYTYFSRALDNEGHLNPAKLSTSIKKLGKNQFKKLVPDQELRNGLLNYSKLENMNKEAQNLMFNPNTGQRNRDAVITGLLTYLGHAAQGNIGAVAAPAAAIMLGRGATKYLTSPSIRESLVKNMIKNENKFYTPAKVVGSQTLMEGLKNALANRGKE